MAFGGGRAPAPGRVGHRGAPGPLIAATGAPAGVTGGRTRARRIALGGAILVAGAAVVVGVATGYGTGSASPTIVGHVAPDFSLPRLGGGAPVHLDALGVDRRRPVVLNFFASWCGPCITETPLLARAAALQRAEGSPVQFVGVDVNDETAAALAFVRRAGINYPVGADHTLRVASGLYRLTGQPYTFFIDASGHIIGDHPGALTATQLRSWLLRLTPSAA